MTTCWYILIRYANLAHDVMWLQRAIAAITQRKDSVSTANNCHVTQRGIHIHYFIKTNCPSGVICIWNAPYSNPSVCCWFFIVSYYQPNVCVRRECTSRKYLNLSKCGQQFRKVGRADTPQPSPKNRSLEITIVRQRFQPKTFWTRSSNCYELHRDVRWSEGMSTILMCQIAHQCRRTESGIMLSCVGFGDLTASFSPEDGGRSFSETLVSICKFTRRYTQKTSTGIVL